MDFCRYAARIRAALWLSPPPHLQSIEDHDFFSTLRRSKQERAGHIDVGEGANLGARPTVYDACGINRPF